MRQSTERFSRLDSWQFVRNEAFCDVLFDLFPNSEWTVAPTCGHHTKGGPSMELTCPLPASDDSALGWDSVHAELGLALPGVSR